MASLRSVWLHASCVFVFFILTATYTTGPAQALRIIALKVPETPTRGSTVTLECRYDLERDELYSVKWSKDGREILRYVPHDVPKIQVFSIRGLTVDVRSSTNTTVVLDNVQHSASGTYKCEVSAEAPSFDQVAVEKRLDVTETTLSLNQPPVMIAGGSVPLNCTFNLGGLPLHSFKWFKDDKILYSYIPRNRPQEEVFSVQGVTVDATPRLLSAQGGTGPTQMLQTNYSTLFLTKLSALSSGTYRCEASADPPPFLTLQDEKILVMVEQRDLRPQITYDRETYQVGDNLRLNCTSIRTRPAPKLAMYVNDRLLVDADVRASVDTHRDGFQTSTLVTTIPVSQHDARRGSVEVRCHASFVGLHEAVGFIIIPVGQQTGDHKATHQQEQQWPLKQPSSISWPQDKCLDKAMEILARAWAAYQ